MKTWISMLYLLLITTSLLQAQNQKRTTGFDPKYSIKDLAIDIWTNKSGLVSNNVISVFQASDDYLWISSYNGLQRFDGKKFEIFDQSNVPYLSSNTIYKGTQDQSNTLWFCTGSSGILSFDGKQFGQLPMHDSIPKSIVSIFADSKNRLWIGSKNNGLYLIDKNGTLSKQNIIPNVTIHDIMEDPDQNIWVATDNQGVFRISNNNTKSFSQADGLPSNLISTLYVKGDSAFIGTLNGVSIIYDDKITNLAAFKGEIINDLIVDDYGVLWVGSERGLIRFPLETQTYEFFSEKNGLPSKRVVDLYFDNEGSLWVCTYEGGLVRFKSGIITNLTIRNGLSSNQVHIIGKQNGVHFIGTQDGAVNIYDGSSITQLKLSDEFSKDVIRDFLFEENAIWIVNYRGLVKVSNGLQTYFNETNGLPDNNVRTIFKDSNGFIWLGTRTGGLIKFDPRGNHTVYDKESGLLSNYIFCVTEDNNGNLLVGTDAGGLSVKSPEGNLTHYAIMKENSGTLIFNIMVDSLNQAWLCTNLGLFRFSKSTIEKVHFDASLKMQKFFDIKNDHQGNLWLSSPIGVVKIKQEHLDGYFTNDLAFAEYELFGEDDGMESQECTGATKSYFDPETRKVWIPTFEGVAIIDPSQKIVNTKIPKVYITSVYVDNGSISPINNNLKIKPGAFRYLFDVTALSLLVPSKVQFKYKLEGIDENWNGPTRNRRIEYTNLPYGDYTLLVQAANNDEIWNHTGAQLPFTVMPYFFETLWFRWSVALFFVLLIWGLYTWRVHDIKNTNRILRKMNSELDRFVYSASHDLRGPLTSTMGLVNLAMNEEDPKQNREYFSLIKQCTIKMNHFINELVNYSKNKNDAIEYKEFKFKTLVESVWNGLIEREHPSNINLTYDIHGEDTLIGDRTRIKVILRNLIHNSIIFSDPTKAEPSIQIRFRKNEQNIELAVVDNGLGIPHSTSNRIFDMFFRANDNSIGSGLGLYVVKETIRTLNADIKVESEEGKGSAFVVTIPQQKNTATKVNQ